MKDLSLEEIRSLKLAHVKSESLNGCPVEVGVDMVERLEGKDAEEEGVGEDCRPFPTLEEV